MPTDPDIEEWRRKYVAERDILDRAIRSKQAAALESAQAALSHYLQHTDLDMIIRTVIYDLHQKFSATKFSKKQIPLDGEIVEGFTPVFILDHQGLPGSRKRFEIPGMRYRFYMEHRELVITVTFCKNEAGAIFPYVHLTHRDDRTHLINWEANQNNPDNQQLNFWLIDQITGLISGQYPLNTAKNCGVPLGQHASVTRSFYPDEDS
ncbi:hypothetical protein A3K29_00490 [Candidatus Collierbacteria bacterium RIFOXYB2_FULL_46_14]|uniref:Uncharacterized protein n=1 Tax=Candidatus Collierbacteria bacterium GW2011_GWA2_46_26 TaxID=1618381 RepID=A0A0G1PLR2_9BACT|nr:MAG: hypothetical protein UW29_C0001G0074 [Candidatus Collierbacteria bacterium GW2011_GWC2_44_13]KKU33666.1 MAG: hypothetical protein UX47_C0002G0074 [Candidatus Collierbacteria bacterium GW2011_GWA2_46_26]OGD72614.1 MAG: hypothetical protein A3K29_00490 [Candidatus Collierbacteria bacterium RIFOXYB2_FULL_46_14]OGD75656.1 MAG: hypothetical protein A3K43_00490 [Candidatus Collierbacteria bacterium RIFOXYA2_FULL_46_20]OGD76992.1 MAG: hypothetical protein A3K39_00490 [Candidatus Collierbacteri